MFARLLAVIGIVLALFGLMVIPGIATRESRRRAYAIHRIHPDDGETPWNLADYIPVGWLDTRSQVTKRNWSWFPRFRRIL